MANRVSGVAEVRVYYATAIECKVQTGIAGNESAIRVVQEVVAGEAELKLPALRAAPSEILKHRRIAIPETWTGQSWEDIVALLARCNKWGKAVAVDVLVGLEPTSWIAGQRGHKR